MEKTVQLYEGKAKKVFATNDPALVIVSYKDDATALNGLKRGTIVGKGVVNNRMTNHMMRLLEQQGICYYLIFTSRVRISREQFSLLISRDSLKLFIVLDN